MDSMKNMPRVLFFCLLLILITCAPGCGRERADQPSAAGAPQVGVKEPAEAEEAASPAAVRKWAAAIEKPGLPNLHKVSDNLYRGAQPTAEGIRELKALGIKTIVNLRSDHSDEELIGDTDIAYERIPMRTWDMDDEDLARFLRLATDESRQPVFAHCQHGADRTGVACAVYRIAVEGWSKEEAIAEMTGGGFGFHAVWKNIVRYMRKLDVERIKRMAEAPVE